MAITIDNAFVQQYDANVRQLQQQMDVRLLPHVYSVMTGGQAHNFDRLGATDAIIKGSQNPGGDGDRRVETEYIDDDWSRRVALPQTYVHTMTVEHEDQVQTLHSPLSEYAINQAAAMRRSQDDIIIAAATADALDGDGGTVVFPPGQIVGDGSTPISFDMVTEVNEIMMQNEITPDMPKVMVVSPTQIRKLMQTTEQTSADYVNVQALQTLNATGIVLNWMGFTWIMSNRLLTPEVGELQCLAFTNRALGLAVNQETFTRIGEDPGMSYMLQIFSQWTMGCVRVEDEHIVQVHVADTL